MTRTQPQEEGPGKVQTCAAGLIGAAGAFAGSAGLLEGEAAATDAGKSMGLSCKEAPALAAAIRARLAAISASVASLIGPCSTASSFCCWEP